MIFSVILGVKHGDSMKKLVFHTFLFFGVFHTYKQVHGAELQYLNVQLVRTN